MTKAAAALALALLALPATAHAAEIRLGVTPDEATAGELTLFRFHATRGENAVRRATVRFAGRRAKLNRRGRAAIRVALPRAGSYTARVGRATATLTARDPGPAAKPTAPARFTGECAIDGVVRFDPPMTNTPQRITQTIEGKAATCTGTFVDAFGQSHELQGADVSETTTAVGENQSCGAAMPAGPGTLFFPHGAIDVTFEEFRIGPLPLVQFSGASEGSLTGYASPTEEPGVLLQKCAAEGISEVHVEGQMQGDIAG